MRKQKDEIPECAYAVYVKDDNGEFKPISFGDSEAECSLWVAAHRQYLGDIETYIGLIIDEVTILP